MSNLVVSIVIPTYYKSRDVLETALKSIVDQTCPRNLYEIIIADNNGGNPIKKLAKKYKARLVQTKGDPPQTCHQVNLGARHAHGKYILILDHDLELTPNLLEDFIKSDSKSNIDAWCIPLKIIAKGGLLTKIRNFETEFYNDSIIAVPRMIKKDIFFKTENQYDPQLNSGPGDWDLTNQLKLINAKFGSLKNCWYHHEEDLSFGESITKKIIYAKGGEIYKNKWRKKNIKIYNDVVKKQYDPIYRFFWIFVERGKWRKLLPNIHLYLLFLTIKIIMSASYIYNLKAKKI